MAAAEPPAGAAGGFGEHDYEIAYRCSDAGVEVRISGRLSQPVLLGDVYTLERIGDVHDFVVTEVRTGRSGGWSARCQAVSGS